MSTIRDELKTLIEQRVFSRYKDLGEEKWIFDFRTVSMTREFMDLYSHAFFEHFKGEKDVQICGLESASIPLVTTLVYASEAFDVKANGLFIRKGRKKHDLHKIIEGTPNKQPVILVDDILNTGKSIEKQIEVLKNAGLTVSGIFCLVRFRDESFYGFLTKGEIPLTSLFELNDFKSSLNIENLQRKKELQSLSFTYKWGFTIPADLVNYKNVAPKSAPVIYRDTILFGTDSGIFYCLDKRTGDTIWTYKILFGDRGKMIHSSPVVHKDTVYFGAYDGNFYSLDARTGKRKWVYMEADWIGSSPCVSAKDNLVYVGLEFGLWKKRGGIVALDANTGKEKWRDTHIGLTHCSPYVSLKNNQLYCGSNDGILRIYNAQTGEHLKNHVIGAPIRLSFSENDAGTKIVFGAFDKHCHVVDTTTLEIVDKLETLEAIYSTPLWIGETIIVNSLDKRVYSYDAVHKKLNWTFLTKGRIFSNPVLIKGSLFVGSNDGALYKLDPETGKEIGHIQFPERIVNKVLFDEETGYTYIPTFANELHCLSIVP